MVLLKVFDENKIYIDIRWLFNFMTGPNLFHPFMGLETHFGKYF